MDLLIYPHRTTKMILKKQKTSLPTRTKHNVMKKKKKKWG